MKLTIQIPSSTSLIPSLWPARTVDCDTEPEPPDGELGEVVQGCRSMQANAVRLQLHALADNLANFFRTLVLPDEVERWSSFGSGAFIGPPPPRRHKDR